LGGKKARTIEFKTSFVLVSDILEHLENMLSDVEFEKLNLPMDVTQIRLTRNDQLLHREDEVMDEDVIYALAKSELTRGIRVDEKKEIFRSRPQRDIHELKTLKNQLWQLENESCDIKVKNTELRNLLRKT
jgi:hypothetical protein